MCPLQILKLPFPWIARTRTHPRISRNVPEADVPNCKSDYYYYSEAGEIYYYVVKIWSINANSWHLPQNFLKKYFFENITMSYMQLKVSKLVWRDHSIELQHVWQLVWLHHHQHFRGVQSVLWYNRHVGLIFWGFRVACEPDFFVFRKESLALILHHRLELRDLRNFLI